MPAPAGARASASRLVLQRVDAQVERRRLRRRSRPSAQNSVAERRLQPLGQPVRQVVAQRSGRAARSTAWLRSSHCCSASFSAARRKPSLPCQAEDRQATLRLAACPTAPDGGRAAAGGAPRRRSSARLWRSRVPSARGSRKNSATTPIGRMLEAQDAMHQLGRGLEQGGRMHRGDYPWRRRAPPRSDRPRPARHALDPPSPPPSARRTRPRVLAHHRLILCAVARRGRRDVLARRPDRCCRARLIGWNVMVWLYLAGRVVLIMCAPTGPHASASRWRRPTARRSSSPSSSSPP